MFDPTLTTLLARTYCGGPGNEQAGCLPLDGDRPVIGGTTLAGVPTTSGALQPNFIGPTAWDGFVARFDPCLATLEYATHLASGARDNPQAIELAPVGLYAVAGQAGPSSPAFPTKPPSSYKGGPWDAFVTLLDPSQTGDAQLVWSQLYGGTGDDLGWDLAVDAAGLITVFDSTDSANFPVTNGAFRTTYSGGMADGFVARLDPFARTGSGLERLYVSYFGGNRNDVVLGVVLDAHGDACMVGLADSTNLPVTPGACQPSFGGGTTDIWVEEFPLLPANVTRISGAASCPEPVIANVNSMPFANSPLFTPFATNAPPGSIGLLVFGLPAKPPYSTLASLGSAR